MIAAHRSNLDNFAKQLLRKCKTHAGQESFFTSFSSVLCSGEEFYDVKGDTYFKELNKFALEFFDPPPPCIILKKIGQGNNKVYKGKTRAQEVAVKIYQENSLQVCFSRELYACVILKNNVNFPRVYAAEASREGCGLILYELMDGDLTAHVHKNGPVTLESFLLLFSPVLEVLACAHAVHSLAHRDIKPKNILVKNGKGKLGDWDSCSLSFSSSSAIFFTNPVCTLPCRAPEFLTHAQDSLQSFSAFKLDAWSLGVCIFYACAGYMPFQGETEQQLLTSILRWEASKKPLPKNITMTLGENGTDFLLNFLEVDPSKRMSILDALYHPFYCTFQ